jgi:hypothetical protein
LPSGLTAADRLAQLRLFNPIDNAVLQQSRIKILFRMALSVPLFSKTVRPKANTLACQGAAMCSVFSVIEKERWHRSNLYSGAPMPYMQRITWSGIALHAGELPGYPASHGCIRLTNDFAIRLWHLTKRGARVIIARHDVVPVEITNPHLFVSKPKTASDSPENRGYRRRG